MKIRFILIIFFFPLTLFSQNIFDKEHSMLFAKYLLKTHQYEYASIEFEKLNYFYQKNDSITCQLLKSYRLSNQVEKALERIKQIYFVPDSIPESSAKEYLYLLYSQKSYEKAFSFISSNINLNNNDKKAFELHTLILQKQWRTAKTFYDENKTQNSKLSVYKPIIDEGLNVKYRSPFLAGIFSAIIPGTGKIYTGWWKDGLLALLSIGTSSWQAYNGFKKDGINSVYGWIFGTIGGVFYLSNIYGSVKTAKKYNQTHEEKVISTVNYLIPAE